MNTIFRQMEEDYDIVSATEESQDNIAQFLRRTFYKHEPLNVAIRAPPDRPINCIIPLLHLSEGISLLAVSRNGRRILGFCGNTAITPKTDENSTQRPIFTEPSYNKITEFCNKIEESADIWKKTGADRAMRIFRLAVDPDAQGRGIGRRLVESSRRLARSEGYPLLYIMCTSHYTAKIARDIGMQCVYSLPYAEYKDKDGNPVFTPPQPHTDVTVFVQKLSPEG
jgi:ribosomal protein S18 acetylase RimI-like enzyme